MQASPQMQIGEGERAQSALARRHYAVKGTLFAIGAVAGAYLGFSLARNEVDFAAPWPPALTVALAIIYAVAVLGGSLALDKSMDELERHRAYKAVAVAGSAYIVVYPLWFLLWKASLVIEPIHWLLFAGFWLLLIGSAIYYRFR